MSLIDRIKNLQYPIRSPDDVTLINEIAFNILFGNVSLTNSELAYFRSHKTTLRKLCSKASANAKTKLITRALLQKLKSTAIRHLDGEKDEAGTY